MKAYSIFDDFGKEPIEILQNAGIKIDIHPVGVPRPNCDEMKRILEEYDCIIIGTSQKISEDMFDMVDNPKIIATASVGLDHIHVPEKKNNLITIINTPKANAQSVAEYTLGCALACCKRLFEGQRLYKKNKSNKALSSKPEDLAGKLIGVVGAGNISLKIMDYAEMLGMSVVYWTAHPEKHNIGRTYVELEELARVSDVISVNIPNKPETQDIISEKIINMMKPNCIFISVSRLPTINFNALLNRANSENNFYVNLDVDLDDKVIKKLNESKNVFITPHIAGGTIDTRKRMFKELADSIDLLNTNSN